MTAFRWWAFKRLCALGWLVCPEPQRSDLQSRLPQWHDLGVSHDPD